MAKIQFQDVRFRNVDGFLEFLPKDELAITELLRKIVFDCLPHSTEKLAYNVPFYKVNRNICFIWPASVKWGSKVAYTGVRFGFTSGYLLTDDSNYLERGNRKQVYWKDFAGKKDIDVNLLKSYILEAKMIDAAGSK